MYEGSIVCQKLSILHSGSIKISALYLNNYISPRNPCKRPVFLILYGFLLSKLLTCHLLKPFLPALLRSKPGDAIYELRESRTGPTFMCQFLTQKEGGQRRRRTRNGEKRQHSQFLTLFSWNSTQNKEFNSE